MSFDITCGPKVEITALINGTYESLLRSRAWLGDTGRMAVLIRACASDNSAHNVSVSDGM